MDWPFLITLTGIGLGSSFLFGLLGIGGAIIAIPALYYIPALIGFQGLDMLTVSSLSMFQVFVAALTGSFVHKRNNAVSKPLVTVMGSAIVLGSFTGGYYSKYANDDFLLGLFALMCLLASLVMFIPKKNIDMDVSSDELLFNRWIAFSGSLLIGLASGFVGIGGGFILSPFMMYILNIPTRITVGSTLSIIFLSALAGFLGKFGSGQINWPFAIALILGAVPGAQVGSMVSRKLSVQSIRKMLAVAIYLVSFKIWLDIASAPLVITVFAALPVVGWIFNNYMNKNKEVSTDN